MSDAQAQRLAPQQVARYCGVPPGTVDSWLQSDRLTAQLEDGQYWIRPADLIHFMHQNHLSIPAELIEAEQASEPQLTRVLVIDEDRPTATNIERVLRQMDLEVIQVNVGGEATATYAESKPQLVTLDLSLDGTDAIELIEHMRTRQNHRAKILIITDSMPSMIGKARQAGADAVLNKPFDNDALRRNVRILLGMD